MLVITFARTKLVIVLLAGILLSHSSQAKALDAQREKFYEDSAITAAGKYQNIPRLYTYAPVRDDKEVAASTAAIYGHIFLEVYRVTHDKTWLEKAQVAGDSIIAHPDMNGDGRIGWGRYWKTKGPGGDSNGGNTYFARDCNLTKNRAYDDELYDVGRITHFLVDLYGTTKDDRYLNVARSAIDDTWAVGEPTLGGDGFSYFKTPGACDQGWHVKNIDMLMSVPIAIIASITGEQRYRERAEHLITQEKRQIDRDIDGRASPNLGYFDVQTSEKQLSKGRYIESAQSTDPKQTITCNLKTGTGESCTNHLGIEARGLAITEIVLGRNAEGVGREIGLILGAYETRSEDLCSNEKTKLGRPRFKTACVAYHCALRAIDQRYDDRCFTLTQQWGAATPEIALSLLWGSRYFAAGAP